MGLDKGLVTLAVGAAGPHPRAPASVPGSSPRQRRPHAAARHGPGLRRRRQRASRKQRDELARPLADDAADVQGVAHLAVEGMGPRPPTSRRIGAGVGDQPGAAGPVQADRRAGLARHRAQLGDRRPRAARHRQGQARVGEHAPSRRRARRCPPAPPCRRAGRLRPAPGRGPRRRWPARCPGRRSRCGTPRCCRRGSPRRRRRTRWAGPRTRSRRRPAARPPAPRSSRRARRVRATRPRTGGASRQAAQAGDHLGAHVGGRLQADGGAAGGARPLQVSEVGGGDLRSTRLSSPVARRSARRSR